MDRKIDKSNIENIMHLTSTQSGMLFYYIKNEDKKYHEQLSLTISGDIKKDILEKAWNHVIDNNEMLRTIIRWKGIEKPLQIVLKKHEISIKFKDLSKEADKEKAIDFIRTEDLNNRIDITLETLRIYLCKLEENKYEMIVSNHHILYDGWSNGIILKELMATYDSIYKQVSIKKVSKTKFSKFIKYLMSTDKDEEKKYWTSYLKDLETEDDCFRCSEIGKYKEVIYKLDENLSNELREFSKENRVLLSSMLYSAWGILLQKINNSKDVVFGTTVSGRSDTIDGVDEIVGLFINTIPLRISSDEKTGFLELIRGIDKDLNSRKSFENTPLTDIIQYSGFRNNEDIFNSIVTIENYPLTVNEEANVLKVEDYKMIEETNYNMGLEILAFDNIEFKFKFNTLSLDAAVVENFGEYLENILKSLVNNKDLLVDNIEYLSESEKNKLLVDFNNSKADYPKDKTVYELFEEQALKTPDNVAVIYEDKSLTYRELNEEANKLARLLRKKGVKADSIVGIMLEKSIDLIVSILGTLKAGGAYLPIDLNYPKDRKEYMLQDSNSPVLITSQKHLEDLKFNGEIIDINNKEILPAEDSNLEKVTDENSLIYVIYTSGTTGKPKGAKIKHSSFTNLVWWYKNEFKVEESDNVLLLASVSFDLAQKNIYVPLISGGKLVVNSHVLDYNKLIETIENRKITILNCAPSMFNPLMDLCKDENYKKIASLRHVFLGGEPLNLQNYKDWLKVSSCELVNTYGPTECTDVSNFYKVKAHDENLIPIGKAVNNTKLYILNNKKLVPIGVTGELCIGGDGVSRGYLNREDLTNEKFIDNPFIEGEKIYKTGDLARWLPDGNVDFLGRIDNQVKIRGLRIELGEIENRLLEHESVKEAAVIVRENNKNDKYICAYYVKNYDTSEKELKTYLKEVLPEYMVPEYIINLEKMPITTNGKLDRRALPEPDYKESAIDYEAPRNETEEALAKIFGQVLGREKVGINDNFFELGGHSLKATVLVSKIQKELKKEVPLSELFKSPSIKELSSFIDCIKENPYSKIPKVQERESYETSSAQKRMYMLQEMEKDNVTYNMPVIFEIQGDFNKEKTEKAFAKLVERHEALRTSFKIADDSIVQVIEDKLDFKIKVVEDSRSLKEIAHDFIRPFNLNEPSLFRSLVVKNNGSMYLLMDMHHIISDGISMSILIKEFTEIYKGKNLEPLRLQYKDFSAWQNKFLNTEEIKKQEEYWINRFKGEVPVLNMPLDFERPAEQSFDGDIAAFEVNEEITSKLVKIAKETGTTMHMVLLSALNILLSKYSGQDDIVIGTPIAGRPHADLQNIMGMFVNTLALRNNPSKDKNYIDFLKEVKENSLTAYENQSCQLETLVDKLDLERDTSRNPLFDVLFNMIDTQGEEDINLGDMVLKAFNNVNRVSKFDLTLSALQKDDKLNLTFEYCTKLFKEDTIKRLCSHYVKVLESIADNVEIKLCDISLLSEEEKQELLAGFNNTKADYPKDKTVYELFEEQALKTPDNIAVIYEDKSLTYKELNEEANKVARLLREKGVKADSIVGIMLEKSVDLIVSILGTLKAGGAYLPIDLNYPKDRKEYMLQDSNSPVLITSDKHLEELEFNGEIIDINNKEILPDEGENLEKVTDENSLIYVIYTSGTTGKPKGAKIKHSSFTNLVWWYKNEFKVEESDNVLLLASVSFDLAQKNIYVPLISGGKLVVNSHVLDYNKLIETIENRKITILNCAPSMFNPLMDLCKDENYKKIASLRHVFLGGEPLNLQNYKDWLKVSNCELVNTYGPTECTDVSNFYRVKESDEKLIPIGKGVNNTKLYILNDNKLVPIGVTGELCIGGHGVSRGYLNREDLTNEKFIDNPFAEGEKIYKTGDLARWMPDGNVDFLGRIDNQVKIRGLRIELGEIENRLLEHEGVKEAAVIVREDNNNDKYICAYYVNSRDTSERELKGYLKGLLPEYMVPEYIINLDKMPITTNGKLDKRALPKPDFDEAAVDYEAPRSEMEEALAKIFGEVLGRENIGINDNFFELGGHSLKATVLISKIHKKLNKEVPLKELFKWPTVKELASYIEKLDEDIYSNIEAVEEKENYEASSAQKRIYMLQEMDQNNVSYNMPVFFETEGIFNKEKVEKVFKSLIERHEALRTRFKVTDDNIEQIIEDKYDFNLKTIEDNREIETVIKELIKPFDLNSDLLFRCFEIKNNEKIYLLIDMHHIISDGVSMSILIKEFTQIYKGKTLEPLKLQYKDFAAWQNKYLKSEKMKKQEEFWINKFKDEVPVLNMPLDFERPAVQSFEGDLEVFEVNENITSKLKDLTKETGTTMHMVLLSALNILLSKYSGQDDIVIGTPIGGRLHADFQNIIGMFVNTLALRNNPYKDKTYIDFLKEVKENSLKAYENQSCQFESLVEKLDLDRDTSRNPLFDVVLNVVDTVSNEDINLGSAILKPLEDLSKVSKFDLTLSAMEKDNKLSLSFEYCTKLFKKSTIERLCRHYVKVLSAITDNMEMKLKDIKLLSDTEKKELLQDFNNVNIDYPKDKTIQELFEIQAAENPNNIAVMQGDKKITYKELDEKSNVLARKLREKGVKENSIVALMTERSIEMIIAIMAALKAGGAYLPIDPDFPEERIEYILKDSKASILLSNKALTENLKFNGEIIDLFNEDTFKGNSERLEVINKKDGLAYVIYTSGTTGKPKGVMIEHYNLNNFVHCVKSQFNNGFDKNERTLSLTNYVFDVSVSEFFITLLSGAALVINNHHKTFDPSEIAKLIIEKEITFMYIPPALLQSVCEILEKDKEKVRLSKLLLGVEGIKGAVTNRYFKLNPKIEIINGYGPTEAAICSTLYKVKDYECEDKTITIGRTVGNSDVYILDDDLELVPIGVAGEICVSGDNVGRGYLYNKELSDEVFVKNPFKGNKKMYKTGDIAKWSDDGNIQFIGRRDNQVKVRGFRVELGEIESKILTHENVKEAVVISAGENENKYICAYIVSDLSIKELSLKDYLKKILPEYMIPNYFVKIEKIPLTANGKLDKRALPKPSLEDRLVTYTAPRNREEEILAEIWSEILGVEKIGIDDDFFDLGGHSLKATILTSRIRKEIKKEVPLSVFFANPTIRSIGDYIADLDEIEFNSIKPLGNKEYKKLSSQEERMFVLNQLYKDNVNYNIPVAMKLKGDLDIERLEKCFKDLVARHDVLRTSFHLVNDKPVRKVEEEIDFKLEYKEIDSSRVNEEISEFCRPFDFSKAPLMRGTIAKYGENEYLLLVDIHHIISDAISVNILIDEVSKLYNGEKLLETKIQYRDYAAWQEQKSRNNYFDKAKEYWLEEFKGEIPVLNLPTDYERDNSEDIIGNMIKFGISKDIQDKLRKISIKTGTTMYMLLLAAYYVLLAKYSKQDDIVVGTSISGRTHPDLYNVLGIFINTLALRNKPVKEKTFAEFLNEVKENSLRAYENEEYQFDQLVEDLNIKRVAGRNPLFDVMFELSNNDNKQSVILNDIQSENVTVENKSAKFDLSMTAVETEELNFILEYNSLLYKEKTIKEIVDNYKLILESIAEDINKPIESIKVNIKKDSKENNKMGNSIMDLFKNL